MDINKKEKKVEIKILETYEKKNNQSAKQSDEKEIICRLISGNVNYII